MALFYLYPDGNDGVWGNWQNQDDPFNLPDDSASKDPWDNTNNSEARFTLTGMPSVASVNSIRVYYRIVNVNPNPQARAMVKTGGSSFYEGYHAISGEWSTYSNPWILNPNTGVAWTVSDLNALIAGVTVGVISGSPSVELSQVVVEVDAVSLPAKLGSARHRGSVEVHLRGRAMAAMSGRFGLLALDRELLDVAPWQHYAGPTVKDEGWGIKPWQMRLGALVSSEFDMDALEVTLRDFDLRRFLVNFRDTMSSEEVPGSQAQGVLRLDPGAGRVFARSSLAWLENPAAAMQGIVQIVRVAADNEKLGQLGGTQVELYEPGRTNSALRSSYKDGLTGITTAGGSTITADTAAAHLLFDPNESGNSLKFVAGSPHVSDGTAAHPVTAAFAANDRIVVSYYHKDDGGEQMAIRIQRSGGGSDYWNDGTGAWAAGPINNLMPLSTTIYGRWISKVIDVGAGTPTITARIVQPSGGTAARVNRGGHLQIELGRSATSPIITQATTVTRVADSLKIENFTGKVVYDPARGTCYVEVVSNINSADLAAGVRLTIWQAYKDASNYDRLDYDQATLAFIFRRRLAGVNYDASFVQALVRGTVYKLGTRWTGTDAEEDLAAYTISLFLAGVKGTDAVPAGTWTPGASEYLYIGQDNAGANLWDGGMKQFVVRPFVFADAEMVDQP